MSILLLLFCKSIEDILSDECDRTLTHTVEIMSNVSYSTAVNIVSRVT